MATLPSSTATSFRTYKSSTVSVTDEGAKQGGYGTTYKKSRVGKIYFGNLDFDTSTNTATSISFDCTFGGAGGGWAKTITFYSDFGITTAPTKKIGTATTVGAARNRKETVTLNIENSTYLQEALSNKVFFIYNGETNTEGKSDSYSYNYLSITGIAINITYTQKTTASPSTFTLSSNSIAYPDDNMTISISPSSTSYSHKITFSLGDLTKDISLGAGVSSYTATNNNTWSTFSSLMATSTSRQGTVTLTTYNGSTTVGSSSKTFTLYIDTSSSGGGDGGDSPGSSSGTVTLTPPSISSIGSISINNEAPFNSKNRVVMGYSTITVGKVSATAYNSSTIVNYSFSSNASTSIVNNTTGYYTFPITSGNKHVTVTVTVTDSRGQSTQETFSLGYYAYEYIEPTVTGINAVKCTSLGDVSSTGTYAKITFSTSKTSWADWTSGTVSILNTDYYSLIDFSKSPYTTTLGGDLSSDLSYSIEISLADNYTSKTYTVDLLSSAYIMHVKAGGSALGLGTAAGDDYTITCGWLLKASKGAQITSANGFTWNSMSGENCNLPIEMGGTGASNAKDARANLGITDTDIDLSGYVTSTSLTTELQKYLLLAGGTITGNINLSDGNINLSDSSKSRINDPNGNNVLCVDKQSRVVLGSSKDKCYIGSSVDSAKIATISDIPEVPKIIISPNAPADTNAIWLKPVT